jgi:hypothetical protein
VNPRIGIKTSVVLTDQQRELLQADAAHHGVSLAEALRRALEEWQGFRSGAALPRRGRDGTLTASNGRSPS